MHCFVQRDKCTHGPQNELKSKWNEIENNLPFHFWNSTLLMTERVKWHFFKRKKKKNKFPTSGIEPEASMWETLMLPTTPYRNRHSFYFSLLFFTFLFSSPSLPPFFHHCLWTNQSRLNWIWGFGDLVIADCDFNKGWFVLLWLLVVFFKWRQLNQCDEKWERKWSE